MKSQSSKIGCYNDCIALKFDRHPAAALLQMCLSHFRMIGKVLTWILRLWDFTGSCDETSICLENRGPGLVFVSLAVSWVFDIYFVSHYIYGWSITAHCFWWHHGGYPSQAQWCMALKFPLSLTFELMYSCLRYLSQAFSSLCNLLHYH